MSHPDQSAEVLGMLRNAAARHQAAALLQQFKSKLN